MMVYRSETAVGSAFADNKPVRLSHISRPRTTAVKKHQPRLTDGRRWPVTVRKVSK